MDKQNPKTEVPFVQQSNDFAVPTTVINKSTHIGIEITKQRKKSEDFIRDQITALANVVKAEFGNELEDYTDRKPLYVLKQVKDRIRAEYEFAVIQERKRQNLGDIASATITKYSKEVTDSLTDDHCIHFNAKGEAPKVKVLSDAEKANADAKQAIKDAKKH